MGALEVLGIGLKGFFNAITYLIPIFIGAGMYKNWGDRWHEGWRLIALLVILFIPFMFLSMFLVYFIDRQETSYEWMMMAYHYIGAFYLGSLMAKFIRPGTSIWNLTIGIFVEKT